MVWSNKQKPLDSSLTSAVDYNHDVSSADIQGKYENKRILGDVEKVSIWDVVI
jgi:hypothetical protein